MVAYDQGAWLTGSGACEKLVTAEAFCLIDSIHPLSLSLTLTQITQLKSSPRN